ncbi:MAG: glycosyltransferase family 9 protein [Elusimicrobiota bacterium]
MNKFLNIIKYVPKFIIRYWQKIFLNRPFCRWFEYIALRNNRKKLKKVEQLERILVVADYNIGDAVNILPAVELLKQYFSNSKIDYVFNKKAASLVGNCNFINRAFPIFDGEKSFSKENKEKFLKVIDDNQYDLIFNFCPFFTDRVFKQLDSPVIQADGLLMRIIGAVKSNKTANLSYNIFQYVKETVNMLPGKLNPKDNPIKYKGSRVFISEKFIQERNDFIKDKGFSGKDRLVYINPDSSNKYTFIRPEYYKELAERILKRKYADGIIIGQGYSFKDVETEIYKGIPDKFKEKILIHPDNRSLDFFAAFVDSCDIYVGADTGPLHIASAKKFIAESGKGLNNKTAVIGLFKATEPAIYGYDSQKLGFGDSRQEAPAKTFEATPGCKNITCSIQKVIESCDTQKCSDSIDIEKVTEYIETLSG